MLMYAVPLAFDDRDGALQVLPSNHATPPTVAVPAPIPEPELPGLPASPVPGFPLVVPLPPAPPEPPAPLIPVAPVELKYHPVAAL